MSAIKESESPDNIEEVLLVRLKQPESRYVADQAREMGLKVGDVIIGREHGGEHGIEWWNERRLTLLYLGERCCVWREEWRDATHAGEFGNACESANWSLSGRDWYLISAPGKDWYLVRDKKRKEKSLRKGSSIIHPAKREKPATSREG